MSSTDSFSRRAFLAATSAMALPSARGASANGRLKAGIVGCGGRGTQAVANLLTGNENVDLVAMADIFEDALEGSLRKTIKGRVARGHLQLNVTWNRTNANRIPTIMLGHRPRKRRSARAVRTPDRSSHASSASSP